MSSAGAIKVNSLTLLLNGSEPLDFADIFKTDDGTSIVFSAASTDITVADGEGNSYENVLFAYDDNGNITGIAAVPEPAALAAVLGALALGVCRAPQKKIRRIESPSASGSGVRSRFIVCGRLLFCECKRGAKLPP